MLLPEIIPPKCPECGAEMVLRKTHKFKYKDGTPRPFWGCSAYPQCTAIHGAHPDGRPLGTPADKETKAWRIKAHDAFDILWKCSIISMTRKRAYKILAERLGAQEVHIGESDIERCKQIIEASNDLVKELREGKYE